MSSQPLESTQSTSPDTPEMVHMYATRRLTFISSGTAAHDLEAAFSRRISALGTCWRTRLAIRSAALLDGVHARIQLEEVCFQICININHKTKMVKVKGVN